MKDPLVGTVLNGRYRVDDKIARGGMAMVYLGTDLTTDRQIAIKVMHAHLATDSSFVERFEREAMNAARLEHPNLISVTDQGRDGDVVYLVMEYLESVTLRKELRHRGKLTPRQAIVVSNAILAALDAVHDAGMIHRDLKPDNVLLGTDGTIKLTDFGLARAVTTATTTKTLIGTVGYVAPELVTRAGADARTDLYTLGIMLYEMLTGSQPYTDEVPIQVAYRHVHDRVPAPSEALPGLPPTIDALVLWATSPEPEDRPESARAFRQALTEARAELSDEELDFGATDPVDDSGPVITATADVESSDPIELPNEKPLVSEDVDEEHGELEHGAPGAVESDATEALSPTTVVHTADVEGDKTDGGHARVAATSAGDSRKARRRRTTFALVAAVAILALVASGIVWNRQAANAPREVPAIATGVEQSDAQSMVESAGLTVAITQKFSSNVPAGRVLETQPAPGTEVEPGGTVTLVVSKGKDLVTVPTLTGLKRGDADKEAEKAGITIGNVEDKYSDAPKGEVIHQSQKPGKKVERSEPVNITVSKGEEPISVPNVKGLEFKSAYHKMLRLGFRVGTDEQYHDTVPKGRVISQHPAPGTPKYPDDFILLRISKGKKPAEDKKPAESKKSEKDKKSKANKKDGKKAKAKKGGKKDK